MAPVLAQQVEVSPNPSAPKIVLPSGPRDMDYFLNHGLEGEEHRQYRDTRSFTSTIESRAEELGSGNLKAGQYAVFFLVTQAKLATINRIRDTRLKGLRFLYLQDEEMLIVKITPGPAHEVACQEFAYVLKKKAAGMGLEGTLGVMGATTYQGIGSQKQANSALKPWPPRPHKADWPTLVIECGLSESHNRLVGDSCWWLENSQGEVKVVILLVVSEADRKIHLEQWEMITPSNEEVTQPHPQPRARPTITGQADITEAGVTGAPFTLEFNKIFLRLPEQGEENFVLTQQDLQGYASLVWNCVQ